MNKNHTWEGPASYVFAEERMACLLVPPAAWRRAKGGWGRVPGGRPAASVLAPVRRQFVGAQEASASLASGRLFCALGVSAAPPTARQSSRASVTPQGTSVIQGLSLFT